jgi:hypothetical protein
VNSILWFSSLWFPSSLSLSKAIPGSGVYEFTMIGHQA